MMMKQIFSLPVLLLLASQTLQAQESLPTPEEIEARRAKVNEVKEKFKETHTQIRDLQGQIDSGTLSEEELKKKNEELEALRKKREEAAEVIEKDMSRTKRKDMRTYKQYRSEKMKAKEAGTPWPERGPASAETPEQPSATNAVEPETSSTP